VADGRRKRNKNVDEVNKRNQVGCTENERRHIDKSRRNMDWIEKPPENQSIFVKTGVKFEILN
jgi:hypothetical protein